METLMYTEASSDNYQYRCEDCQYLNIMDLTCEPPYQRIKKTSLRAYACEHFKLNIPGDKVEEEESILGNYCQPKKKDKCCDTTGGKCRGCGSSGPCKP